MSDKMRWRYGDTNPVVAAVDSATVIEIGDCVWQDIDDAKPASDQTDQGSWVDNQQAFATKFLGVAMQRSRAGDTCPIRVATTGVFDFDCQGATFELGDLVGLDDDINGKGLLNQQVRWVSGYTEAIGRVARREAADTIMVLVDIRSTVMTGCVLVHSENHSGHAIGVEK